ncbi:TRAP transporter substrate-binding protein [Reinekea blandensis]|uniref:TRAP transporter substrate-binding protein n=1 Tax=Reinekea blandensis TaxID=374838 RepID=UPI0002E8F5B7|nr:TRAP transporter substrate-binding protein [Reinekea blandensis]
MYRTAWLTGLLLIAVSGEVFSADFNLRLHHFLPEASKIQQGFLEPWAQKIEEDSDGRIAISIHGGMSLGGAPSDLVSQVEDGTVDMVWTVAGYTPGKFPRTEVFELPTVHFRSAYASNRAIYANFELIAQDYTTVKPLLVHVNSGNAIHLQTQRSDALSPADLQGLSIRSPSRTGSWYIEALGASPVALPAPAIRPALVDKSIDGALLPFEILPDLNLTTMGLTSSMGKDGSRFGTSSFLLLMNPSTFNQLPEDLQQVLNQHTGLELYKAAGIIWDEMEVPGMQAQRDRLYTMGLDALDPFETIGQQVVNRWIDEVSKQGIDGQQLVDNARKYVGRYSRIITSVDVNF